MDFVAFDIVVGYLTAFAGAVLAVSLLFHPFKQKRHAVMALGLIGLSLGFILQSLQLETLQGDYSYMQMGLGMWRRLPMWVFLFATYFLGNFYFRLGTFSWAGLSQELVAFTGFSLLTAGILFLGGVTVISLSQYILAAGLVFCCLLSFGTLYRLLRATSIPDMAGRLFQLSEINKSIVPFFLRDLAKLPEIKKIELLSAQDVESLGHEELYAFVSPGVVYSVSYLKTLLKNKRISAAHRLALTEARELLENKNSTAFVCLENGKSLLLASPRALASAYLFEATLYYACDILNTMSRHVPARKMAIIRRDAKEDLLN